MMSHCDQMFADGACRVATAKYLVRLNIIYYRILNYPHGRSKYLIKSKCYRKYILLLV